MAEGWAQHLLSDRVEAYSAGIETHGLNPHAVRVMSEVGVDISGHRSKHVNELIDIPFDYVITVCDHARESCPLFPGKVEQIHAGFEDPPFLASQVEGEGKKLDCYRKVRDRIKEFIIDLPNKLEL
jgi:arsenate reductase